MAPLKPLGSKSYFSHQRKGIRWMIAREGTALHIGDYEIYGGILADEMGLGKTFEILGLIANNVVDATLILTPLAVVDTWIKTATAAGIFNIYVAEGGAGSYHWSRAFKASRTAPAIYIANMEKMIRNPSLAFTQDDIPMDRLVVDEAHKMRNCMSSTFDSVCAIIAPLRWAVTATPVVNSMKDVASLVHFIGGADAQLEKSLKWDDSWDTMLPELVLRRTVAELRDNLDFLPEAPITETVSLDFSTKEEETFYNAIQGNIKEKLMKRYMYDTLKPSDKLLLLLRLRQISVHPQVYIESRRKEAWYKRDDWEGSCTKFSAIRKILRREAAAGENNDYLIFCSFKDEIELLRDYLLERDLASNVEIYYGEMTSAQREKALARAEKKARNKGTDDKPTVVLCQINSGGVGLNLQYLNRVIFLSPWWTAATMEQACGRVLRIGQERQVKITYLQLTAEFEGDDSYVSIDDMIYGAVYRKKQIADEFFGIVAGEVD
jgi:SNF2 family DNA or RNA helicase